MCVIIDANLITVVFGEPPHEDFLPVVKWLFDANRDGCLVYGGRLGRELLRAEKAKRAVVELARSGKARKIPDDQVDLEEENVSLLSYCSSNDQHVIALARVSGARVLCTYDGALQRDFTNARLLSRPRGHVYQRQEHAHLLRHTRSCGRGRIAGARRSGR